MENYEPIETQIIEEKDIIDVSPEQPEKECKTCKQKSLTPGQWAMIISSFYILFASIYGTIKLVENLLTLIN
jgi:hypothetical protein